MKTSSKRNILLILLISLLISSSMQWRTKTSKCKETSPPPPPPAPPVLCTDGFVKIGLNMYTKCVDCIAGSDSSLGTKLNTDKIFGSNGWSFGGTVGPSIANTDNLLGLVYNGGNANPYSFTKTSTKKYEIVVSLKAAGSCFTPYYFPCTSFTAPQDVLFNTKGVDKGTGQTLEQMTYYYKECPVTPPPTTCDLTKFTYPPKTGTLDCSVFATVKPLVNGVPTNSQACFGSYTGNLEHDSCTADEQGKVCLYRVLNSASGSLCGLKWCFVEKVDVKQQNNYGSYLGIILTTGRSGTFDIKPTYNGPFVLTMKAANFYSAYYFASGNKGSWTTSDADLSHSSLWVPCSSGLSFP